MIKQLVSLIVKFKGGTSWKVLPNPAEMYAVLNKTVSFYILSNISSRFYHSQTTRVTIIFKHMINAEVTGSAGNNDFILFCVIFYFAHNNNSELTASINILNPSFLFWMWLSYMIFMFIDVPFIFAIKKL